ncbi:MAG: lipoate--protein ligase [Prevotella sp.]|nr:lipoate--protein ligase [Prevotella sp.]
MVHIVLQEEKCRDLSFYLAMEEYVARHLDVADAFFIWQVQPSVIFGRNQLIENEVNIPYCEQHHVKMFRRKSGGGCVYADMSNMMLAYITQSDSVNFTYHKYTTMVTHALKRIGIPATANGRNDILIDGKKVSGNAFYHLPGRSIVHGTMLYDTDMRNMVSCITPDDDKLVSKGVKSVRQRITLLKDHTSMSLEEIRDSIIDFLCDDEYILTSSDISRIEEIEKEYTSPKFIFGNNPKHSVIKKKRFDGVGTIEARMEIKNDVIKDIDFKGDFFLVGDIGELCNAINGTHIDKESLLAALPDNLNEIIINLNKNDLLTLIID